MSRPRTPLRTALALGAAAPLIGLVGCNSTDSADQVTNTAGSYLGSGGSAFFVDANFGGLASSVRIARQYFGRLVRISAQDDQGVRTLLHENFVIDPRPETAWDDDDYILDTNPVTGEQTLVILADHDDTVLDLGETETGADRFVRLLRAADAGTRNVADNGFVGAGTYTMVPRNAAIVVVFDDLINPNTVNTASVRVLVGEPTVTPFEARILLDPNHGDLADADGQPGTEFYSTRLIIDPAISELESFNASSPVSVNLLGLPASQDTNLANVELRFPTIQVAGQIQPILKNLSDHALTTAQNGTFDFGVPAREIVRAFRSGGRTDVTGDPSNGFLLDQTAPRVIGSQAGVITMAPVVVDEANLVFDLPEVRFSAENCATDPRVGDIIAQSPFYAEVVAANTASAQGIVNNLRVRLVVVPEDFDGSAQYIASGQGPIAYRTAYDPLEDAAKAACFIEANPTPPDPANPTANISTATEFTVRFNEAIDPGAFEAYEGIALLRKDPSLANSGLDADVILPTDYIPGSVLNDSKLEAFTFRPLQDLTHVFGEEESYFFQVASGARGPRDLAGNTLADVPARIEFTVNATLPTRETGGRVIRFNSADEEWPFADPTGGAIAQFPKTEWFGNVDYDLVNGRVRPRSVVRSQVVISQNTDNIMVSQMINGAGTSLPLNPLGARTQFVWRYLDMNLPLYTNRSITEPVDLASLDLDVEGIYLSPLGATPVFETYPEFSVSMSHSGRTPNEVVNPQNVLTDPLSGVTANFDGNQLSLVEDPPKVVSRRERGYEVNPGDRTVAADGTVLVPLAMNQDLPVEQWSTYTYRSTGIDARGGSSAVGAPVTRYAQLTGVQAIFHFIGMMGPDCTLPGALNPLYDTGDVRTAGLPLMVDVKCYPTNGTSSQNQFGYAWAHAPNGVSDDLPGFLAYSAGGENQAGSVRVVDPDAETIARGGFDPTSTPPGAPLPGVTNIVYYGALDFVTRVSRMHSIFYPAYKSTDGPDLTPEDIAGDGTYSNPVYLAPLMVPATQPQGTEVNLSYRVTRGMANPNSAAETTWAGRMDPYGDFYESTPVNYIPPDETNGEEIQADASCFDGSFDYVSTSENPNASAGFVNGSDLWTSNLAQVSGVEGEWIQVRVTFINNIATGQFPQLSALALSWRQN